MGLPGSSGWIIDSIHLLVELNGTEYNLGHLDLYSSIERIGSKNLIIAVSEASPFVDLAKTSASFEVNIASVLIVAILCKILKC